MLDMSSWIVHIFYLTDQSTDGQHILAKRQRMRAHCAMWKSESMWERDHTRVRERARSRPIVCFAYRSANQCVLLQFTLSHFNVSVDFMYRFVYDSQFNFKYKSCRVLYMLSVYE